MITSDLALISSMISSFWLFSFELPMMERMKEFIVIETIEWPNVWNDSNWLHSMKVGNEDRNNINQLESIGSTNFLGSNYIDPNRIFDRSIWLWALIAPWKLFSLEISDWEQINEISLATWLWCEFRRINCMSAVTRLMNYLNWMVILHLNQKLLFQKLLVLSINLTQFHGTKMLLV